MAAHDAGMAELAEDVLEEVERNPLRARDPLGLDGLFVRRGRQLDHGAHGVVGFGRDPHALYVHTGVGTKP
jgi:hypothetical protein